MLVTNFLNAVFSYRTKNTEIVTTLQFAALSHMCCQQYLKYRCGATVVPVQLQQPYCVKTPQTSKREEFCKWVTNLNCHSSAPAAHYLQSHVCEDYIPLNTAHNVHFVHTYFIFIKPTLNSPCLTSIGPCIAILFL